MRKIIFVPPGKQTVTMPQSKPKNELLNRMFALIFAVIILAGTYYFVAGENGCLAGIFHAVTGESGAPLDVTKLLVENPGLLLIGIIMVCLMLSPYIMIIIGLLVEIWKPSLDFRLNKDKRWRFASIILFSISISLNVWWWIANGLAHWLPERGWQATTVEYFLGLFACDTSTFSLLFGILFLTKSVPQKSLSYKFMLIGPVINGLLLFPVYIAAASGIQTMDPRMVNFWGYTFFQPWFWFDLISEIVVFIGVLWLLRRVMNLKN